MNKVCLINLGCPKNLVDSETIAGLLENKYFLTTDLNSSDVVIINTCCFINDAYQESIETIEQVIKLNKKIIVVGCLVQKYHKELEKNYPQIVALLGTSDFVHIIETIEQVIKNNKVIKVSKPDFPINLDIKRKYTIPLPYSYIKIAEGCNHCCTFCIIPDLKGKYKSKSPELILKEAKNMVKQGIKEINLIAQDTTFYGKDIGTNLCSLLKILCNELKNKEVYFRLLYTYPQNITNELLELISNEEKLLPYLDIPLQHSHPEILKKMARPYNIDLVEFISNIRAKIPDIVLRTTFIVGFPEENNNHFLHLKNFIKQIKFDNVGIFKYSNEKGTRAYTFNNHIPEEVKEKRREELMLEQQKIVFNKNKKLIGKKFKLLVERIFTKEKLIVGRTYRDAPEIDCLTYVDIKSKKQLNSIKVGDYINIKITDFDNYDTIGEYVE